MGLEITRKKDGSLRSKWWYGRFAVNGKNQCVNLGIEIKGRVPSTLRELGNPMFERSRAQAQAKLDLLIEEARSIRTAESHLEKLYEIKAGTPLEQVPLEDLEREYDMLPSKKGRSTQWIKTQHAVLRHFRDYIRAQFPQIQYMGQVTPPVAKSWLYHLEKDGLAGESYNKKLNLLKSLFQPNAGTGVVRNPFVNIPTKLKRTIHRQPFTPDELKRIINLCDPVLRPVFITGMCTAMRKGDCCRLRWDSLDLENNFISVRTSKTGETAEIPLFSILREIVEQQPRQGEYVFPEAEKMYRENANGLSWRLGNALDAAGIKRHAPQGDRNKRVTIRDFHSLRTTWITMALTAGIPMELVRRVTGHATVEVVLEHYFRPDKDAFRKALAGNLPQILTGEPQTLPFPSLPLPHP